MTLNYYHYRYYNAQDDSDSGIVMETTVNSKDVREECF